MKKIILMAFFIAAVCPEPIFASEPVFESIYGKAQEEALKLERDGALLDDVPGKDYANKKLFILISSGIPDHIVRNFITTTSAVNERTVFVLRGFVGDMKTIRPTLDYIEGLLCGGEGKFGDPGCLSALVDINPDIFERFGVDKVPAVIYLPDGTRFPGCGLEAPGELSDAIVSYGDGHIETHLEKMRKAVGNSPTGTEIGRFLERFKEGFHKRLRHSKQFP